MRRRAAGAACADDPLCSYDLLRALWEDVRVLGEAAALQAPIFRRSARGGPLSAFSTSDVERNVYIQRTVSQFPV